jgi:2-polyprenyl-6-methoxyphenol hydroxylase-like FAD-dependent oxidoreductase
MSPSWKRHDEPPSVKCNHVSARTMEIFRRVGVASRVRDAGLPSDFPNDVSYRTTVTGIELARIPIPCRRERYTATGGPDTWWPTPEPPHRINQVYLEPILLEHAGAMNGLRILSGTRVVDFDERRDDVVARALINSAGILGSAVSPFVVGVLRDLTGSFASSLWYVTALLLGSGLAISRVSRSTRVAAELGG